MTLYPFEMQIAVDADNPDVVVRDGTITFYDPSDTGKTNPITLVDSAGLPMANPMRSSPAGFTRGFQATIPHVMWSDGTYSGYLSSYKGLLDEAIAAREAAEAAIVNGVPSGGATDQVLAKASGSSFSLHWVTPQNFVLIGPSDAWPTGLPDGTIVIRTET
jgi:hypothetical protein